MSSAKTFEGSAIGIMQNTLKSSVMGPINRLLSESGIGRVQGVLAASVGFSSSFLKEEKLGLAHGLLGTEGKHFGTSLPSSFDIAAVSGIKVGAVDIGPSLSLGTNERRSEPVDRSVDAWLREVRPDLSHKHRGMWDALETSLDPVLHSTTSAVELLSHLLKAAGVSDSDVRGFAKSDPELAAEAIDASQGFDRVTWAGRARIAAILGGFDAVGQEMVVTSLAVAGQALQRIKHSAHRYGPADVETHLRSVDVFLTMMAWCL